VRILWITDIHADKKTEKEKEELLCRLEAARSDVLFLTGDIAEGEITALFLEDLWERFRKPVFFVLGNHDYHGSFLEDKRRDFSEKYSKDLVYLPSMEGVDLGNGRGLVGIDNWYNLLDHPEREQRLEDFEAVLDFQGCDKKVLESICQELCDKAIEELDLKLKKAFASYREIDILMHVPPFYPRLIYGEMGAKDPFAFCWSCHPLGQFLMGQLKKHPHISVRIFSGHTHKKGFYKPLSNLEVRIGNPASCIQIANSFA